MNSHESGERTGIKKKRLSHTTNGWFPRMPNFSQIWWLFLTSIPSCVTGWHVSQFRWELRPPVKMFIFGASSTYMLRHLSYASEELGMLYFVPSEMSSPIADYLILVYLFLEFFNIIIAHYPESSSGIGPTLSACRTTFARNCYAVGFPRTL